MNKFKKVKKLSVVGFFVLISVLLISCLDSDDQNYLNTQNSAWVAVINASPGSSELKFYNNGTSLNSSSLEYGDFLGYFNQNKGSAAFTVRDGNSLDLDTLNMDLMQDFYYSVFAINTSDNLELITYIDNHNAVSSDKSLIRFIQLSPNAPSLKLLIENEEQDLGTYLFKQASPFLEVNSGLNRKFHLVNTETDEIVFTKEITLGNGKVYSIFSKGIFDSSEENLNLNIQSILLQ